MPVFEIVDGTIWLLSRFCLVKARAGEVAVEEAADADRLGQPEAVVPVKPIPKPVLANRPQTAQDHASYYLQV